MPNVRVLLDADGNVALDRESGGPILVAPAWLVIDFEFNSGAPGTVAGTGAQIYLSREFVEFEVVRGSVEFSSTTSGCDIESTWDNPDIGVSYDYKINATSDTYSGQGQIRMLVDYAWRIGHAMETIDEIEEITVPEGFTMSITPAFTSDYPNFTYSYSAKLEEYTAQ